MQNTVFGSLTNYKKHAYKMSRKSTKRYPKKTKTNNYYIIIDGKKVYKYPIK
jgi:hypothetical protein